MTTTTTTTTTSPSTTTTTTTTDAAPVPGQVPAGAPAASRSDRALWAVVLVLGVGGVAYVVREHPTLTGPVTTTAAVATLAIAAATWLRRS
ncbi:hypothetical protein ACF1FX_34525 [Streptomyces sp. NPDC014646]|uniref:hypothetical protein n=1 Tax=Streptomyces sp. NPDC014646 TaxID=3364877 RepID=UPI00370029EB